MVSIKFFILGLLLAVGTFGQSPCSLKKRQENPERCLSAIRNKALDKNAFVFGNSYFDRCRTDEERKKIDCYTIEELKRPYTLAEKVFKVPEQDLTSIDRFLSVVYISPPGTYHGCDTTYSYRKTKRIPVDPLSNAKLRPWDVREHPITTWEYEEGEFYTLVVLYATGETLAVVSNIAGNDFSDALRQKVYTGPRNPRPISIPVVYILYKEQVRQDPRAIPSYGFNVTDYAEKNQLIGPLAFTWHDVTGDLYSAGQVTSFKNCGLYVKDAIRPILNKYDFLPSPEDSYLTVNLRIKIISPAFTYDCPNYSVINPAAEFYVDSISGKIIDTAYMRADTERISTLELIGVNPDNRKGFEGKRYTALMVQPYTMYIHGIGINMRGPIVDFKGEIERNTGNVLLPYTGPFPQNDGRVWHYMWLIYEQKEELKVDISKYQDKSCFTPGRCMSNLSGFIKDYDLKLAGLARMSAIYDEYTSCVTGQAARSPGNKAPDVGQNELF